jgi:hypothetical protein
MAEENGAAKAIRNYWQFAVGMVMVGLSFGALQMQVAHNDDRLDERKSVIEGNATAIAVVRVEMGALQQRVTGLEAGRITAQRTVLDNARSIAVTDARFRAIIRRLDRLTAKVDKLAERRKAEAP